MFKPGDRVRFFDKRGGYVVGAPGGLRAVFPDLSVTYLDHCEPDEEGNYFTKQHCALCNAEHRSSDVFCINCGETAPALPAWLREWLTNH